MKRDKREIKRDKREIKRDKREIKRDKREIKRDKREIKRDKREIKRDKNYKSCRQLNLKMILYMYNNKNEGGKYDRSIKKRFKNIKQK
ncbi:hypothetical protein QUV80_12705 [Paraclostridium benzoelyticum]|nr:hypothetical protein [Paraclostridium benzoelyticum]